MPVNAITSSGASLSLDMLGGTQSLSLDPVRDVEANLVLATFADGQSFRVTVGPDFINGLTASAVDGGGSGGDGGTNLLLLSSSDELESASFLLLSGDAQSGTDRLELSGDQNA